MRVDIQLGSAQQRCFIHQGERHSIRINITVGGVKRLKAEVDVTDFQHQVPPSILLVYADGERLSAYLFDRSFVKCLTFKPPDSPANSHEVSPQRCIQEVVPSSRDVDQRQ